MRRVTAPLAAIAVSLGLAAPASAFEVAVPTAAPADTKAGAHSDVKLRIEPKDGQVRDIDIHFPPGLVGDPNATEKCTHAQFEAGSCPPQTKLGTSNTEALVGTPPLALPQTLAGEIFNLQVRGDEPARLGIIISPPAGAKIKLESPVTSRPTDGGLDSTLRDLPNTFSGLPVTITALDVTLLGTAPTGKPFMQNPTGCGLRETVVDARSYADERAQGRASFESVGCKDLPFAPSFEAIGGAPGLTARLKNPPLTTIVGQTPGQANVRRVSVKLPADFAVAASRLGRACPQADFDAGTCAPTARIGEATAITPLLTAPLQGPVTFVSGSSSLPDLVLSLRGPLSLTLKGVNEFAEGGQVTTFDGIPDVPLSRFELRFFGGEEGLLAASRDLCQGAPPTLDATFTSHAETTSTVAVPAKIEGCTGTGSGPTAPPAAKPRPKASVTLRGLRKGRPSLRLRVTAARGQRLRGVRLNLPRGMKLSKRTRLTGARAVSKRRGIVVPARRGGSSRITLTLRAGTLTATKRLRRAKRVRLSVVATESGGRRTTRRLSVRSRR